MEFLKIKEERTSTFTNYYIMIDNEKICWFSVSNTGYITRVRECAQWYDYMFADDCREPNTTLMRGMLPADARIRRVVMECIEDYFLEK